MFQHNRDKGRQWQVFFNLIFLNIGAGYDWASFFPLDDIRETARFMCPHKFECTQFQSFLLIQVCMKRYKTAEWTSSFQYRHTADLPIQTDPQLYKFPGFVAQDYVGPVVAEVESARNVAKCELEWLLGSSSCNEMEVTQFPIHLTFQILTSWFPNVN
jgi:hypothetical protein